MPVLLRDILYNLIGLVYAMGDTHEESIGFYTRLIKDNKHYIKRKGDYQFYVELGCHPDVIDIAPSIFEKATEIRNKKKNHGQHFD